MASKVIKRYFHSNKHMSVTYLDKNNLNNNNNSAQSNQNDIIADTSSFTAYDYAYNKEMRARLRSILIYSILFNFFFTPTVALCGLYFGIKAKKEITAENYPEANKFLTKADYSNLIAFIFGITIYLTTIIILAILYYFCN